MSKEKEEIINTEKCIEKMVNDGDRDNEQYLQQAKKMVWYIIHRHISNMSYVNSWIAEEYEHEGLLGMEEAAHKYDPEKGTFCSFCRKYVWSRVYSYYIKNVLHLTLHYGRQWLKLYKAKQALENQNKAWNIEILHEVTGISLKTIRNTLGKKSLVSQKPLFIF